MSPLTLTLVTVLLGAVIPIAVAITTAATAHPGVKAVVMLALAAAAGFLTAWQLDPDSYDWRHGAVQFVVAFVVAVAAHYGLLARTALGVTGDAGGIQRALPGGIGARPGAPTP